MRSSRPLSAYPELIVIQYGVDDQSMQATHRPDKGKQKAVTQAAENEPIPEFSRTGSSLAASAKDASDRAARCLAEDLSYRSSTSQAQPVTEFRLYRRKRRKRDHILGVVAQILLGWIVGCAILWILQKHLVRQMIGCQSSDRC